MGNNPIVRRLAYFLAALLIAAGISTVTASPAQATPVCSANYLCFHQCYLSGSCGSSVQVSASNTSCINIFQYHLNVLSVRNRTAYRFKVWDTTDCGAGFNTPPDTYLYANTDGNMNSDWDGDAIGSIKRG